MIVVVILGILATLMLPRMTGSQRRRFDLAVDQVADLLLMYAQRGDLGRHPVGLSFDGERDRLMLMALAPIDDSPTSPAEWTIDPLVRPVELPGLVDAEYLAVYADGEPVDIRRWPLTHAKGQDRPTIELYLRTRDQALHAGLRLAPNAIAPTRITDDYFAAVRTAIDLDAAGRSREDW